MDLCYDSGSSICLCSYILGYDTLVLELSYTGNGISVDNIIISKETALIGYVLGIMGIWILQDALASIAFYPQEKWRWNHIARLVRAGIGIAMVIIGAKLL